MLGELCMYTYRVFCSWLIRLFITSILVQSLELTQGMAGQLGVGLDNFAQYTLSGTTQGKIRNISKYWSFLWQILIVSVAEVISFIFFKSEAKFFINLNIGSGRYRYAPNTLFWFCRISCPFDNRISGLLQPGIRPHTGYKKKDYPAGYLARQISDASLIFGCKTFTCAWFWLDIP